MALDPDEMRTMISETRRMFGLVRPELRHYLYGFAALLMVNLADVLAPLMIALAVDLISGVRPTTGFLNSAWMRHLGLASFQVNLPGVLGAYLVCQVLANLCRYPMLMCVAVPSHRLGQTLRNRLVGHLLQLPRSFYDRSKSGDLMSLATSDIQSVRMFYGPGILLMVDTVLLMVFVLAVMFSLSWSLTLVALLPLPLIALFTNRFSHAEFSRFGKVQEDLAKLTERARESYAGIRIIQGYAREAEFRKQFAEHSGRHLSLNLRLARVRSLFDPSLDLFLGLSTVLVLTFGGLQLVHGAMTLGSLVAFLFLVSNLSGPMVGFGWAVSLFQRCRASSQRLEALWAEPTVPVQAVGSLPIKGPGHLTIRNLVFSYPGMEQPALSGIQLELPPGKTLGIIGPVGGGKTTLVHLLVRLYDPPAGTIFLDGIDIRELSLAELRRTITLAPQDTFLFGDTIAGNILLAGGTPEPDPMWLAELAQIDAEITDLPEGLHTLLGERGYNLSGGQRQRLAIARAVGVQPRLLILDDCLSAVDARTEEAILLRLDRILEDRSGILISHRVRTVQHADEIIVLQEGRIVERGRHEQLMQRDGYYASAAREQTLADNPRRT